MKINWKLRFKNPLFWVSICSILLSNLTTSLHIGLSSLNTWQAVCNLLHSALLDPVVLVSTLFAVYMGAVDYTTPGLGDTNDVLDKSSHND